MVAPVVYEPGRIVTIHGTRYVVIDYIGSSPKTQAVCKAVGIVMVRRTRGNKTKTMVASVYSNGSFSPLVDADWLAKQIQEQDSYQDDRI